MKTIVVTSQLLFCRLSFRATSHLAIRQANTRRCSTYATMTRQSYMTASILTSAHIHWFTGYATVSYVVSIKKHGLSLLSFTLQWDIKCLSLYSAKQIATTLEKKKRNRCRIS
ncbi:hypothetical protein BDB00DRAFT_511409 [Zychaea mexicana]|uniref:uncharacterized protein n=1 Tax=Zychaea mexicana TaxID=64656 RepID=UPI0022FED2CD|nr:uncharacterized protein BDB00DRAFT_511409 [Zychaea mexicana]KAI9491195.1 hypothetical protein BDB00DRAFT_511409 [Zychaea mexicana]